MFNATSSFAADRPLESPTPVSEPEDLPEFVCISSVLRRLLLRAEITKLSLRLASLEGEAGSGKHLLAQTIHRRSPFATLPFRRRDAREWLATEADSIDLSGTLYLDRVDLLASQGQNLLLNLIKLFQDAVNPPTRFLLLTGAHTSLRKMASYGLFLPDLAFRLTAVRFCLPPLREHREDIAPITQGLLDRICRRYRQPTAVLGHGTLPRLLMHNWPGNVRELASVLESAILESSDSILRPNHLVLQRTEAQALPPQILQYPGPRPSTQIEVPVLQLAPDLTLRAAVHRHIQNVLELNRGNKLRTSRQLGISRSTLYRILGGADPLAS